MRENELCDGVLLDLRTGEGRELGKRPAFSLLAASFTSSVVANLNFVSQMALGRSGSGAWIRGCSCGLFMAVFF